jgi:hypothetical protein
VRADDEVWADGPSAAAVLAVAEGLRRRDPQLSAALAEHAARLSDDGGRRGEAELSAVLARRELDRPDEVASRGVPALREAEREGRDRDAAVLRCTLADAALTWSDVEVARKLLAPLASGEGLPEHVRLVLAVARADLAAATGDVATADATAAESESFSATREERLLARSDLLRARARARRVDGDLGAARDLLERACREPVPDAVDGGRRQVLAVGELVEVFVALGEPAAAGEAAEPVLGRADDVVTALPLARLRCRTASGVRLPAGELDEAEALARVAADGLAGRGHERAVAGAEEVLAAVAEARGDLAVALAACRRAHHLERQALVAEAPHRVGLALAVGCAPPPSVTASGGDLPGRADLVGRRRARPDTASAVRTNGARAARHGEHAAEPVPPRSEGTTPHGLTRILEEITADARSAGRGEGPASTTTTTNGHHGVAPAPGRSDDRRNGAAALPGRGTRRAARPDDTPDTATSATATAADAIAATTATGADTDVATDLDEYAGELRLTRQDLLAEYGATADDPASSRGGTNGHAAGPAGPPPTAWSFHDERGATGHAAARAPDPSTDDDSAEPDGGARLADLLAEAMDAFRRAAPEHGSIDPTPSERRPPRWRAPR